MTTGETMVKRCPFCGYDKTRVVYIDWEYAAMCLNCNAYGPSELNAHDAIEMWNMRREKYVEKS